MEHIVSKSRKLPEVLTEAEIEAILNQFNCRYAGPWRNSLMIRFALETGMRISELTSITFDDCTLEAGAYRVHIKGGKGDRDRMVWLNADLYLEAGELAEKMGRDLSGLIFPTRDGGELDHGYLRRMIKARGKSAGVDRLHFHLLRHTALTRLYAKTLDIRLVQEVAGHTDPKTTAIYAHVSGSDIREAMVGPAESE